MKKTFLTTALLVAFIITSFASSVVSTATIDNKAKLVEKVLLLEKTTDFNNEETIPLNIQKEKGVLVCGKVTLTCGVSGWVCGEDALEMNDNVWEAESFHCDFDGTAGQLKQ